MFNKFLGILLLLAWLASPAMAQEGHPLVGTWQGEWGASEEQQNFLTLILNWDGQAIGGMVNPGPGTPSVLKTVQLDSSTWSVHIEMDLPDETGKVVNFVAEGRLENIGSPFRTLTGTWNAGGNSGQFSIARQGGA